MEKQCVVFAFYKGERLLGYRLDTVGTIGMEQPKIYTYSRSQVDSVLENIQNNVKYETSGFGEMLKNLGNEEEGVIFSEAEKRTHRMLQDARAFEVRVIECPSYEYSERGLLLWGTYPFGAIAEWIQYPENHNVLETHYFTFDGQLNLQ